MTNHKIPISTTYQTLEQILQGIEEYFECRLSDEQEKQLRQALAMTEYRTPEIEECIAVMGFKAVPKKSSEETIRKKGQTSQPSDKGHIIRTRSRRTWITVAASIMVAILIAIPLLIDNRDSEDFGKSDCYAYVGGTKITDEDVVMRMLMEDLEEFDQSINQLNNDFDSTMKYLSQIIEENENPL